MITRKEIQGTFPHKCKGIALQQLKLASKSYKMFTLKRLHENTSRVTNSLDSIFASENIYIHVCTLYCSDENHHNFYLLDLFLNWIYPEFNFYCNDWVTI